MTNQVQFLKGVMLMNEISELIKELTLLIKQLSELLEKVEYIAIKRNNKKK